MEHTFTLREVNDLLAGKTVTHIYESPSGDETQTTVYQFVVFGAGKGFKDHFRLYVSERHSGVTAGCFYSDWEEV